MKWVYIVTHGKAEEDMPNPGLTREGREQIERLKHFLPESIDCLVSGSGKRHEETLAALLGPDRKPDLLSESAGVPETQSADKQTMIFPDGRRMSMKDYMEKRYSGLLKGAERLIQDVFEKEGETALVVGGRIAAMGAGIENPQSGVLYVFGRDAGKGA